MRSRNPGKSQSNPVPDAVRRRRDEWRQARARVMRFPQPNHRPAISRRGAR